MALISVVRWLRRAATGVFCSVWLLALPAAAQSADARSKLAADLLSVVSSPGTAVPWARLVNGEWLVKVIVVAESDDAGLLDLRRHVLSLGGSVFYNYTSIRGVAVMLPASRLLDLASRPDVLSVSPNRAVARTASLLRLTTGAAVAGVPGRGPLDGSGIGIAVLDSGIAWNHQSIGTTV